MKQVKAKQRNGFIDILRVMFALLLVEYHFHESGEFGYQMGKIGVEFFVVLSGFLFFTGWRRALEPDAQLEKQLQYWKSYMIKRFFRFFWYALVAFAAAFLVVRVWRDGIHSFSGLADALSGDIWEISLVTMNGLNRGKYLLNGPAWTLSSMLLAEFFILGMLTWGKSKFFLSFFMPASMLCGFGYWVNMADASIKQFLGLFTFGTLRVYLLICCGIISYLFYENVLKQLQFTVFGKWILTLIEILLYTGVFVIACERSTRNWQYVCICAITIAIAISFSNHSYTAVVFKSNRITNFLADYSLGIFLTHMTVLDVFEEIYPKVEIRLNYEMNFMVVMLVVSFVYTIFMYGFMRALPGIGKIISKMLLIQKA